MDVLEECQEWQFFVILSQLDRIQNNAVYQEWCQLEPLWEVSQNVY